MQQVTVGTSAPVLLAPAGKRDFVSIYNNGSNPLYLCFDGSDSVSTPPILVTGISFTNTQVVTSLTLDYNPAVFVGQQLTGTGVPAGTYVTAVTQLTGVSTTITVSFTATAGSSGNYTVGGITLTSSVGYPIPAGSGITIDNHNFRNCADKAVYGITSGGNTDVRLQGV